MSIPQLRTKLIIPPQRPNLVFRSRLVARLEEGQHHSQCLTLVSAKAGSGKTTLVSGWVHQQARPTAWLSLDSDDNDPYRFFSYLSAALNDVGIKISQPVLNQMEASQIPPPETLFAGLIDPGKASSPSFIITLDDYHLIQNEAIHHALEFLIEHQPPEMHLICITRTDPPLPLARLRARSQIVEIRDRDLQFTSQETAAFFSEVMGLHMPAGVASTLEERTEGWVAGLQLAAISVKGHQEEGDLASFVKVFGGTNRYILDYLTEEILKQQPAAILSFLVESAILERMSGELCDAVRFDQTEDNPSINSQSILNQLEQTNLFVVPLDDERRWYRYHHLFADLLTDMMEQQLTKNHICELHRRASRWHQREGSLEEAMRHAMAAQDYEQAASMIDENIASMFSHNEVPVLLGWIEKLPEDIVNGCPWIAVHRANTLVLVGRPDEIEPLLKSVEQHIEPNAPRRSELSGHIAAIRAYAANLAGDAAGAIEMATLAKKHLPDDHPAGQGTANYTLADTYIALDDMGKASQALLEMLKVGEMTGQLMIIIPALCDLAAVRKIQGKLHQAKELFDQAYQWLQDHDSLDSRLRCSYEFGRADLLREWNQLDAAYEHALIGDAHRQRLGGYQMVGDLTLMRILQARGDLQGALEGLSNAEQIMEAHLLQLAISIEFKTGRILQYLALGDIEKAKHWAKKCNGGSEREQIALASLHLAQGQAIEAQRLLDQQSVLAEAGGRTGRLIEILSLQALSLRQLEQPEKAAQVLSQALYLAIPEGYVRTFLDHGQPLYELLGKIVSQDTSAQKMATAAKRLVEDYARQLLKAFQLEGQIRSQGEAQALIDPLTNRELEVLEWLAAGLSNKTIADRLVVAPSTVKQHLKNIYGKLDVHNRTEAVARGRELGLL